MKLVLTFTLCILYNTSIAIFRLILLLNITPECTLHSRVKGSITHNSVVIFFLNFLRKTCILKMWILFLHFYEKVAIILFMSYIEFYNEFSELGLFTLLMHIPTLNQVHVIHTWFSYCFIFKVHNLFISWLWELRKLTMVATQIWLYAYWNKYFNA